MHSIAALSLAVSIGAVGSAFAYHGGDSILRFGASYLLREPDVKFTQAAGVSKTREFKINPCMWNLNAGFKFQRLKKLDLPVAG